MFDLQKALNNNGKCKTVSGMDVRIICHDANGAHPIVGLIEDNGNESPWPFTATGEIVIGKLDLEFPDLALTTDYLGEQS